MEKKILKREGSPKKLKMTETTILKIAKIKKNASLPK